MTRLSVNINKIATLRNARGGNFPDLINSAIDIINFGADGITVHPRPDERHIRYNDTIELGKIVKKEFNIEGNPNDRFMKLVTDVKPTQVTLVPDRIEAITSNSGWNTKENFSFLKDIKLFIVCIPNKLLNTEELSAPTLSLTLLYLGESFF